MNALLDNSEPGVSNASVIDVSIGPVRERLGAGVQAHPERVIR
jgi:hypothetical protein